VLREHLAALLYSLCVNLGAGTLHQLRVWKKFDDEPASISQLVTMWCEHRAHLMRKGLMVNTQSLVAEAEDQPPDDEDDDDDEELIMRRLAEGHTALTQLTIIMLCLAGLPSPLQSSLRAKVGASCKLSGIRFAEVVAIVRDHRKRTGEEFPVQELKDVFC
jgi:hypothetical protein